MEIFIVRHGLSEGNAKMIFQGHLDFPLADEGRNQAEHLGNYFRQRNQKFDRILSSPFKRARETAELVTKQLEMPPKIEFVDAFKEFNIGKLEGIKSSEVLDKYPAYYQRPPSSWLDFSEYGGESWEDMQKRVDAVMHKYVNDDDLLSDKKLLIVSHGGAMRGIIRNLLQIDSGFMFIRVENCCHFKLNFVMTRGHLRRYLEYIMPLTSLLVDGKPYEFTQSEEMRAKSVS